MTSHTREFNNSYASVLLSNAMIHSPCKSYAKALVTDPQHTNQLRPNSVQSDAKTNKTFDGEKYVAVPKESLEREEEANIVKLRAETIEKKEIEAKPPVSPLSFKGRIVYVHNRNTGETFSADMSRIVNVTKRRLDLVHESTSATFVQLTMTSGKRYDMCVEVSEEDMENFMHEWNLALSNLPK